MAAAVSREAKAELSGRRRADAAGQSQPAIIWRNFRKHRVGLVGLAMLALMVLASILVPVFSPFSYSATAGPQLWYAPFGAPDPSGNVHLLGTDSLGRDLFTRLFFAGRISLSIAIPSAFGVVLIGCVVGAIAGFYGGWIDNVLMRITDFLLSLPLIPMYLYTSQFLKATFIPQTNEPLNTERLADNTLAILGLTVLVFTLYGWMGISRLVRGSILSLRSQPFVEAARALGASDRRIIFRHLLPNAIAPILVAATFAVGDFVIIESLLSYMGQGATDTFAPSWGNLLAVSEENVWYLTSLNPFENVKAYTILMPSFMILFTVLAFNYVGDALRDALDPHDHA